MVWQCADLYLGSILASSLPLSPELCFPICKMGALTLSPSEDCGEDETGAYAANTQPASIQHLSLIHI